MGLRGSKLDGVLFPIDKAVSELQVPQEDMRGRNQELVAQRDQHMFYQYEWYSRNYRNSYPWKVKALCSLFYLTESTVTQKIAAGVDQIMAIKAEGLSEKELRKKFVYFDFTGD